MAKKQRVKKIIQHKRPPKTAEMADFEKKILGEVNRLLDERFAGINKTLKDVSTFCAQAVGQNQAQIMVMSESIDKLDTNVLCMADVLQEVFGQLTQIEHMLRVGIEESQVLVPDSQGKKLAERIDPEQIRAEAKEWFQRTVAHGFQTVAKKKTEENQRRQEAAARAKAEAEKKAAEANEAARVEAELKKAETPEIIAPAETPAAPPAEEGVEYFGE